LRLKRIVVMISGGGSNLQAIIDSVKQGYIKAEIVGVLSNKSNAFGISRAEKEGIPVKVVEKEGLTEEEFNSANALALEKFAPDLIVLAGYLSIIEGSIIQKYKNRIINVHPSLIPAFCGMGYYGLRVHEAVLSYGAKLSGATTHFVDEGADTGPVIMQKPVQVLNGDTPESLQKRILEVEHEILTKSVKLFCEDKIRVSGRKVVVDE